MNCTKIRIVFSDDNKRPKTYLCDNVEHDYKNNVVRIKNAWEIIYTVYGDEYTNMFVGDITFDFNSIFYYGTKEVIKNDNSK